MPDNLISGQAEEAGRRGAGPAPRPVSNAFVYMDAIRAACALTVVFSHAWALLVTDYSSRASYVVGVLYFLAGFGHASVVVFFVLSGYWIAGSVISRTDKGRWRWSSYLVDRLTRLLVVLVPTLLLGGALDYISAEWLQSTTFHGVTGGYVLRAEHERTLSLDVLVGNLLFLQGLAVPPFGSNGPLWSLAYEFWFYLWFPALWLLWRARRPGLGLLTLLAGVAYPQLILGFLTWMLGASLHWIERRDRARLLKSAWGLPIASAVLAGALTLQRMTGYWWIDPILGAAVALFLLTLLVRRPAPVWGLAAVARYGARASFSLYAIHFPVLVFVATLLLDQARLEPSAYVVILVLCTVLLTAAAAWLFAGTTEAHTATLRAALKSRRDKEPARS